MPRSSSACADVDRSFSAQFRQCRISLHKSVLSLVLGSRHDAACSLAAALYSCTSPLLSTDGTDKQRTAQGERERERERERGGRGKRREGLTEAYGRQNKVSGFVDGSQKWVQEGQAAVIVQEVQRCVKPVPLVQQSTAYNTSAANALCSRVESNQSACI